MPNIEVKPTIIDAAHYHNMEAAKPKPEPKRYLNWMASLWQCPLQQQTEQMSYESADYS